MPDAPAPSTRTVDRALQLLASVGAHGPLTLTEASQRADLPASTALRLLRSLESAEFVARADDGLFRPGPALIRLGAQALTRDPLVELAHGPMTRVAAATRESVYLAIPRSPEQAAYIAIVEGTHSVRHTAWVGHEIARTGTAAGRALSGEVPPGEHVVLADSVEPDVTAVCAPITVGGRVIGALSTVVPSYRCTEQLAARCGRELTAATETIAQALGEQAR